MHEQMKRLYKAAKEMRNASGQSEVARLLNSSPQTLNNWEARGISKGGMITAQEKIGCSVVWLETGNGPMAVSIHADKVHPGDSRKVWVIGNGQGGFPDRIWEDGGYPVGASDEYAEVATEDNHAFVVRVWGESMVPRYMPGEYALVEPGTAPEIEDDVLVRLKTGETMIKRLLSRRAGIRLGSYGTAEVLTYAPEEVTWIYYVSHPIPARKIKHWVAAPEYSGEDRRHEDMPHDLERRGIERGHVKYFGYPVPDRMKGKKNG